MTLSLMKMEQCCLTRLEIKTRGGLTQLPSPDESAGSGEETEWRVGIDFDVRKVEDEPVYIVPINIDLDSPDDASFEKISVSLTGVFSFPEDAPSEEVYKYVPLLCLTNLFGVARGLVAQATGMCESGPFLLPLVNMQEVVKSKLEAAEKQEE